MSSRRARATQINPGLKKETNKRDSVFSYVIVETLNNVNAGKGDRLVASELVNSLSQKCLNQNLVY